MARGRMINTSITRDEEFNLMSVDAQFIFMRTIPFLDRDGLISGNTALLWSDVAPLLPQYATKMEEIVNEWCDFEFCIKYKDGRKDILFFPSFRKNQSGMRYEKEAPSQFSPPPGYIRTKDGLTEKLKKTEKTDDNSSGGQGTDEVRTDDVKSTVEEKRIGREGEDQCARTHENTRNDETFSPPLASPEPEQQAKASEESYPVAKQGEYMPGLADPRRRFVARNGYNRAQQVNETITTAAKMGIDAQRFRLMVDAYLDKTGKRKLADLPNDTGEQTLFEAQNTVLDLCILDPMFRTVESVESVFQSWFDFSWAWSTTPSKKQFLEHASQMASGTVKDEKNKQKASKPAIEAEERSQFSAKELFS